MVANILHADPPNLSGLLFQNMVYQIKRNDTCSNMVARVSPADHPYQIKLNHKCNNMVANILPAGPPNLPWGWVKIIFCQNMVMLHIKLKEMTHAATW